MPHLIHCGEVDTVRGSSVKSLLELSGGPRLDEAQADSLDGPLTALFVFNGAIDGLDRRLQLNEPRAGVYCLFTLKWRRDDLCEGASVLNGRLESGQRGSSAWIFERISPVLLIVASNCLIKHRQPAIGRKLPRGAGIVFDQLILFSENLSQNASLGHFIGVALAPLAKPETNSKLLDVFSLATISFSVS